MQGPFDPKNIGQDKAIQDPEQAFRQASGTYNDAASKISDAEKFPCGPMAPAPSPFGRMTRSSGNR